ncbi:winged helix-turn-helix domain-containing protein [Maricaulis sp. CAU 1757]
MTTDFDASTLDDAIHGRLRLAIMAYLSAVSEASFAEIKAQTGATDGNLSVHLRKLAEAGHVDINKRKVGRKTLTSAGLTESGRAAWSAYLEQLQRLIDSQKPKTD